LLYDQIQREHHEKEKGGASKGLVYHPKAKDARDMAVRAALTRMRDGGVTTIIWVDEAQTLTIERFGMLRRLVDITTRDGAPVHQQTSSENRGSRSTKCDGQCIWRAGSVYDGFLTSSDQPRQPMGNSWRNPGRTQLRKIIVTHDLTEQS
jgi:hypothetical protein